MSKVSSYEEYMEELDGRGDVIVFRGQANSEFVLIPSGLRQSYPHGGQPDVSFCG